YDFPIRCIEGHGLQARIIDEAKRDGAKVIVTTDCGTKDLETVEYAASKGIDVIITDHHIVGKTLPKAFAIINPYMIKKPTPEQKLSGAGVSFKLIVGVAKTLKTTYPKQLYEFLLAVSALGTISDRVSLQEPMNRAMVSAGIRALNNSQMPGLKALIDISVGQGVTLKPRDISRTISPRLNAPGRIGNPHENIPDSNMVVDLMLAGLKGKNQSSAKGIKKLVSQFMNVLDIEKAIKSGDLVGDKAEAVDEINEKRKRITEKIELELEDKIAQEVDKENDRIIIIKGNDWNSGVIGIDADRVRDRFHRPVILVTEYTGEDYVKGSCRSIPNIDMYSLIEAFQDAFIEEYKKNPFQMEVQTLDGPKMVSAFGGHAQACGFSMHKDDFQKFKEMVSHAGKQLDDSMFNFAYEVIEPIRFNQVNAELLMKLEKLSPYGQGFEFPVFMMEACTLGVHPRPFGSRYSNTRTPHVEFEVLEPQDGTKTHTRGRRLTATGFGLWEKYQRIVGKTRGQKYDIIFSLDKQPRKGKKKTKLRLLVEDIRPTQASASTINRAKEQSNNIDDEDMGHDDED
ncbi:MAG: DHHA1 domain-containing protein, partial [bacterium]|nr:DHHA1 domain-containing protein [bacterium]